MLRPVLRWIAQSESREISTATALLLVVGIAYLMLQIGLSDNEVMKIKKKQIPC